MVKEEIQVVKEEIKNVKILAPCANNTEHKISSTTSTSSKINWEVIVPKGWGPG